MIFICRTQHSHNYSVSEPNRLVLYNYFNKFSLERWKKVCAKPFYYLQHLWYCTNIVICLSTLKKIETKIKNASTKRVNKNWKKDIFWYANAKELKYRTDTLIILFSGLVDVRSLAFDILSKIIIYYNIFNNNFTIIINNFSKTM